MLDTRNDGYHIVFIHLLGLFVLTTTPKPQSTLRNMQPEQHEPHKLSKHFSFSKTLPHIIKALQS